MANQQTTPATTPITPTGCCPPFDPATMHEKEIVWEDKPFVREHVHSIFHIPIDMRRQVTKAMRLIEAAHATPERLMLGEEVSPWRSELYIGTDGPVAGAETVNISGTFLTRVYEGPFKDAPSWIEDMKRYADGKGRVWRKFYLGYTTCPKCAKAYGKNYVVVLAEVMPE